MTENEKRMHRACFTGHRPEKLMRSENAIRKDLEKQIRQAVTDGLNVFISGMATMPSELLQYSTVKKVEQKIRWIMLQKSACLLSVLRDNIAFLMQTGSAATQKRSSQSLLSTKGNRTAIAAHIVPKSLSGFGGRGGT